MKLLLCGIILFILCYGFFKRVPLFDSFISGAKNGMSALVGMLPALLALLPTVAMLRASGLLEALTRWLAPVVSLLGIDAALIPTLLLRPLSGSGSIALLNDLFTEHGADSPVGITASVLLASSETTLYVATLYFGAAGIKKTGRILAIALLADVFAATLASFLCG